MKVALFVSATPFVRGGTELLIDELKQQLEERGHKAKLFRLPFTYEFETGMFLNALSAQLLNFDYYDVLLSFKWPTYLAAHRHKNLWIFHQFRQAYDMFGEHYGLNDDETGNAIKQLVIQTDAVALNQVKNIFALSQSAKRLEEYSGIVADVLYTPLPNSEKYHNNDTGNYIYCASRMDGMKRQLMAVEAMRYTKSGAKLILDGKCEDDSLMKKMYSIIETYGLDDKVTINAEFVPEAVKIDRFANCLAGIYIPLDEDSPGLVTFEILYSHKALITVNDSGGVANFSSNSNHAFVVEPTPQAIAEKIDYLYENKAVARQMGENAYMYIVNLNVNWDDTIRRLLA